MRLCRRCGATLSDRVEWCGQCGSRAAAFSTQDLVGDLTAVWAPFTAPAATREPDPRPARRSSRWKAGTVTYGPRGRIGLTAAVGGGWLGVLAMLLVTTIGPILVLAYTIITLPGTVMILRDVWKPDLVVEPPVAAHECAACGAPRRQGARACHICFAAFDPKPAATYSRTAAGPTTFGPLGRWVMCMGVFAAYTFGLIFAATLGPATMLVYSGGFAIAAVGILRAVWRRARVA